MPNLSPNISPQDNFEPRPDGVTSQSDVTASTQATGPGVPPDPAPHRSRLGRLWHALTGTKKRVAATLVVLFLVITAVIGFTPLKYTLLGSVIKSNIEIRVTDATTRQLLPGATVKLAGATATTDKTGAARFTGLHAGAAQLVVSKPVYQTSAAAVTLGFGDQAARDVSLNSDGIKVSFKLADTISGAAVKGARLQVGDADAVALDDGTVTARLAASTNGQTLTATIAADGYNDATSQLQIGPGLDTTALKLVPAGKVYYLSNRTGRVDLYEANLDGSAAAVVLAGTGNEDDATGILPNVYDQSVVALVSSRAGKRVDGRLQEDLYLLRPASRQLVLIEENVSYYNYRTWLGKSLIYQKDGTAGTTTATTINTYDPATGKKTTVATCTSDRACPQAVYSTDNLFVYALSGADPSSNAKGLFAVKAGGTSSKSLSTNPASSSLRQALGSVVLQYYNANATYPTAEWQSLDLGTTKVSTLSTGPASTATRTYIESADDTAIVSVASRDGQSDLYQVGEDGKDIKPLTTSGKVSQFVQWFGSKYVVYADSGNQLFVVALGGGQPQKIANFYPGNVRVYGGGYNPSYQ